MGSVAGLHELAESAVVSTSYYDQTQIESYSDSARTHLLPRLLLKTRNRKTSLKFKKVLLLDFSDCKNVFKNALGWKNWPRVGYGPKHIQMPRGENRTDHRNNRICITHNCRALCGRGYINFIIKAKNFR